MRKLVALALGVAAAAVLPAAPASAKTGGAHAAATRTVAIDDNFFRPRAIRVRRGTVVVFRWRGTDRHNARGYRGQRFDTGQNGRTRGRKGIRIRARRGARIRYVCDFHPAEMRGTIRVSRRR